MKYIYYGNELYHHGIKGQKWGVRNGPPYPLSSQKTRSSYGSGMDSAAALAALSIAVVAPIAFNAINNKGQKVDQKKNFKNLKELEELKTLSNVTRKTAVQANVFDENDRSVTENCPNCVVATELRLRGYDVKAQRLTGGQSSAELFEGAFTEKVKWCEGSDVDDGLVYAKKSNETTEVYKKRRLQELSNRIAKTSGKNTSGVICYHSDKTHLGHVFNYVVDGKGNVTYLDGQDNLTNAASSNVNSLDESFNFNYARLDNLGISKGTLDYVRKP